MTWAIGLMFISLSCLEDWRDDMHRMILSITLGGSLLFGVAHAQDFPPRKAGLWQVDMTMAATQMPPQQMKMCIDSGTDAEMYKMGMNAAQGMCSKPDINRSGSTVTVNSTCKMGNS